MNSNENKTLRTTIWCCAGIFLVACAFSLKIVFDAVKAPVRNPEPTAEVKVTKAQTAAPEKLVSARPEQRARQPEFVTDYHEIRKMEIAVDSQVEKMKEYAANNPEIEDALSAEEIEIIKKEGVLVQ